MIKWSFEAHSCHFSGKLAGDRKYNQTVNFKKDNPRDHEFTAYSLFEYWMTEELPGTGKKRNDQFKDVKDIHRDLWAAAEKVWGPAALSLASESTKSQNQQDPTGKTGQTTVLQATPGRGGKYGGKQSGSSNTQSRNTRGKPNQGRGGRYVQELAPALERLKRQFSLQRKVTAYQTRPSPISIRV